MQVKLTMSTPEIEISNSAKICYASSGTKDITSSLVHERNHLSVLRFAYASFRIEGISRSCANQLVRSSFLQFLQESMRYVDSDKGGFEFIMPEGLDDMAKDTMTKHWELSVSRYKWLRDHGVKKEDARAVLPMNTSTKINVSGNLQAYMDFMKLRLTSHSQLEIRNVAKQMYMLLAQKFPQVFTEELFEKLKQGK